MATTRKAKPQTVWMVSREYDGLAGAGGVKDVCRQMAETLASAGRHRVRVILPRYGFMDAAALGFSPLRFPSSPCPETEEADFGDFFAVDMNYTDTDRLERVSIWKAVRKKVTIYLVETERFAEKMGVYTYTAEEERLRSWQLQGEGHYDYFAMNILLQKAALELMILLGERPDIIHCQDGHAAVLPAMAREKEGYRNYFRHTGMVVTIHNAGIGYHQEVADLPFAEAVTGLPRRVIDFSLLDKAFDPFIAASPYAILNTVSEQYALELQQTDDDVRTGWLGHALRKRGITLAGVTNGINPRDFDVTKGKKLGLAAAFDPARGRLSGKLSCKEDLLSFLDGSEQRSGIKKYGRLAMAPELPLLTFIGRLTAQKGVDLLLDSLTDLLAEDTGFQVVALGGGAAELAARLTAMAESESFAGRLCFLSGYDQELALRIYAAGDFFLIPSLYEPCGLTDYIAQLLGNLPVVHSVGGLVKVIDDLTGFSYAEHSPEALSGAIRRALSLFRNDPEKIARMQQEAFQRVREYHSWVKVKDHYISLYDQALRMACGKESL